MNSLLKLATVSALALIVAVPAIAQTAITGIEGLNDRIDDITEDVNDDLTDGDDAERFGPNGVVQGWRGSFALSASGTSGNTDNGELSAAGRLTYGVGEWNHLIGFAAEYGEANGVKSEETFFATYEGSRYFTEQLYAFGIARVEYNGFQVDANGNEFEGETLDGFLGFGPGYRVLNKPDHTWRIQGGPGVRYFEDVTGQDETEVGFIASSRYFYAFTDTVALTVDTDILGSDINTIVTNDAGVNFKVSDNLSTRISHRTEYNTDPAAGLKSTDNSIGLSLVMGF
ncbi:Salt-stress induced outer membrane protein [Sulfitobacter noctilucae]|uniref:DUF481 domain-containing protein n=1 Tax=Sulfitobacter noctilucae TaxID=1342302 RepID=UPI0004681D63|nr:DUF481 domain-containing protein [Sulfitobacter noctilucae]KIN61137.1 Salt-stress induced outer membrane protein [Sulfitobacter noctilucae]